MNAFSQIIIQNVPLASNTTLQPQLQAGCDLYKQANKYTWLDPIYAVVTSSITTSIPISNMSLEIITLFLPKSNNINN